jgi:hypothetical protein
MSVFARNYREHYGGQEMKCCRVCGEGFVSAEQSSDVIDVLQENQIRFQMAEGFHLAELCLPCRRKYRIYRFTGTPVHQHPEKEANQHAKG